MPDPRGKTPAVIRPSQCLSSSAARDSLPGLVKTACAVTKPSKTLVDRAVEIGPYNRGGAWLVPAADAQAAIRREAELRERVAVLEEQLENLAIADFVRERVATASGRKLSGIEFVRSLGFDQIADEIEAGRQPAA